VPRGLGTEVPQCCPGAKPGVWGESVPEAFRPPEAEAVFVNDCLNFDVLKEKVEKWAKIPSSKIGLGRRGKHKPP